MVILTSESDSNTSGSKETQHHFSYYFFSLTTDVNRVSRNLRVPAAQQVGYGHPGVRSIISAPGCLLIPLRLQSMATLKEGDQLQMWEFIRI